MYVPAHSRESRLPVLHQAIEQLRFGTLVTVVDGDLQATHLPMLIEDTASSSGTLVGHIARDNPQWRNADRPVRALATFIGPNFYVTPAWYATKVQTGKVVPTWLYIAVEGRGHVRFFHDRDRLLDIVSRLTVAQEATRTQPWSVSDAPPSYIEGMLGAIVGFELPLDSLEGAWKLGQHRSEADRAGVAAAAAASNDPDMHALLPLLSPAP